MNIKWKFMAIILLSALLLGGCGNGGIGSAGAGSLDYQYCASQMSLWGDVCGTAFRAELTLGEWDGTGSRPLTLVYSEPEALCGVSIVCEGGVWAVKYEDLTLTGSPAERLSLPAQVFSLTGEVTFIGTEPLPEGGNASVLSVRLASADDDGKDAGQSPATARVCAAHDGGKSRPISVSLDLPDGRSAAVNVTSYVRLPAE